MAATTKRLLEICCADTDSVRAAVAGEADRIELCSALSDGGITPSEGLISFAIRVSTIPINILIRPRGGDFVYSPDEVDVMLTDINTAARLGVSGVVIGALTPSGDIDVNTSRSLIDSAHSHNLSVTFHRAFDLCKDPIKALDEIISLGADRLLTSGQASSAPNGKELLKVLIDRAADRIIIMPGAGVNPTNVADLLLETGANEVHASASMITHSRMTFRNESVNMGASDVDEYSRKTTSKQIVKELANIVHNIK